MVNNVGIYVVNLFQKLGCDSVCAAAGAKPAVLYKQEAVTVAQGQIKVMENRHRAELLLFYCAFNQT